MGSSTDVLLKSLLYVDTNKKKLCVVRWDVMPKQTDHV